ncbi:FHA domain-containing protein [Nymphaea thermarum]|uniref:FHA domain-containing protein FHA2 isoform X3 n=1 Tax=Nymphaea colorata TaxID=210225 RepID=UPI00129DFBE1|nr:FHA domain-containing protein FHA2 isoform X3 [Nymphaea colorata]KAF3796000.1 FHA domain-containing protein [Nymphaea thermarum]
MGDVEAGFAKLQGEDFEYYMQTYSIVLGRNSKKSVVDVDLTSLGGGMNISRHHARIFYDFQRRRFALDVIGKNGCLVEGVLHLPGNPPVKLDSQDLLQIGDKKFYFLLPVRGILHPSLLRSRPPPPPPPPIPVPPSHALPVTPPPSIAPSALLGSGKKGHGRLKLPPPQPDYDPMGKRPRKGDPDTALGFGSSSGSGGSSVAKASGVGMQLERKGEEARARTDREAENHQFMQQEEKDVVSSVAIVLSDLCGPGEWMPMEKLHAELIEQYNGVWPHSRVRRYLTSDDWPILEAKGRPWFGLLTLLRKYPEHFVINTRSRGRVTSEFVSLVSLLS